MFVFATTLNITPAVLCADVVMAPYGIEWDMPGYPPIPVALLTDILPPTLWYHPPNLLWLAGYVSGDDTLPSCVYPAVEREL